MISDLEAAQRRALTALALAADHYEPFVAKTADRSILDIFLANGLAEEGPSCRPAVAPTGHRLSPEGKLFAQSVWGR